MSRGYCHDVPVILNVEGLVNYFRERGKPTVRALRTALSRVGRNNKPKLLWRLYEEGLLTRPAARRHVGAAWSACEHPEWAFDVDDDYGGEEWLYLFWLVGCYTVDGKRAPRPEQPLTLYRGAPRESQDGWSWTDDRDVAQWFADRFPDMPDRLPSFVWTATVEPWRLFCRNHEDARGESEYVIDTSDLEITEATNAATPRDTTNRKGQP